MVTGSRQRCTVLPTISSSNTWTRLQCQRTTPHAVQHITSVDTQGLLPSFTVLNIKKLKCLFLAIFGTEKLGTGRYSDSRYSDKCFWKGATNTNSNPNHNLNPNTNPDPNPFFSPSPNPIPNSNPNHNPLHYPFQNVGIAVVGIAAASRENCTFILHKTQRPCHSVMSLQVPPSHTARNAGLYPTK